MEPLLEFSVGYDFKRSAVLIKGGNTAATIQTAKTEYDYSSDKIITINKFSLFIILCN